MKLWINKIKTPTHHIVKLYAQEHSNYKYIGDLSDKELKELLVTLQEDIDLDKNLKLLSYYGYLNLFIKQEK